jgi:hypothetical protein
MPGVLGGAPSAGAAAFTVMSTTAVFLDDEAAWRRSEQTGRMRRVARRGNIPPHFADRAAGGTL